MNNTHNINLPINQFGLAGGVLMSLTLLIFQFGGLDYSPFLKLSKYIVLGLIIGIANYQLNRLHKPIFFERAHFRFENQSDCRFDNNGS